MSEPSYVIGSSFSLNTLTEAERQHLDRAPWVFACNSFLSHWEAAGFRPTVWAWGDNDSESMVTQFALELSVLAQDGLLQQRLQHVLCAMESHAPAAQQAARNWGMPVQFYRRGAPWIRWQQPGRKLGDTIYHYGSTFTNLVNLAAILNPGQPIHLFGNEWGPGFGHFWEGPRDCAGPDFWQRVKRAMWEGLSDLRRGFNYPLVDCNRHSEPLPLGFRLPTADSLCGFPQSTTTSCG